MSERHDERRETESEGDVSEMCLRDIWMPDLYSPLCYACTTLYLSIYVYLISHSLSLSPPHSPYSPLPSLILPLSHCSLIPSPAFPSPPTLLPLLTLSIPHNFSSRLFSLSPGDALGMKVVVGSADKIDLSSGDYCGVMVQVAPQHPLS